MNEVEHDEKIVVLVLIKCLVLTGVWLWHEGAGVTIITPSFPPEIDTISRDGTARFSLLGLNGGNNGYSFAVHRNDKCMELIYKIEGIPIFSSFKFYFSDDMMYMAYRDDQFGIIFYAYGEVVGRIPRWRFIEDYRAGENIAWLRLWDIHWEFVELNSDTLQFTIETDEGRTVVFDMTNGNILHSEVRTNNINSLALYGTIATATALIIIAIIIKTKTNEVN